ncbi:fumarylacetoacetate hydrolase family protein [Tenuifilum thalassicum]|uniref:Fumarylacetoacetate hydrolase family protein n=1 Tax=Tenuifilum thalassicum TaxID=2590900 RepID=A0A7D4CGX3_9BACT|nr:fumarylacetoacetate hydrolase family protein [Tenuifilum thalassicum]QKG80166.1 fumarylacetoacetate hydrolase family protein [Tenuifilum thalassicum]
MKIICIGRNYREHAKELNNEVPEKPVFFIKPDNCLLRNNQPFFYPDFTNDLHYELEVVLRINRLGRSINKKFAHRYYDAITLGIDFTARDLQQECKQKGLPWEMAKAFDYSAPIGPFIPKEDLGDLNSLDFYLKKNGEMVQHGNTADMIYGYDELIEHVSKFVTFRTGDLLFTGTPSGVGPVKVGDRLQAYLGERLILDFFVK